MSEDKSYFVTHDNRIVDGNSRLDPVDIKLIQGKTPIHPDKALKLMQNLKEEKINVAGRVQQGEILEEEEDLTLTPQKFEELSKVGNESFATHEEQARKFLDQDRAAFIRSLRIEHKMTWRAVARAAQLAWMTDWDPPANQVIGQALCKVSAEFFNEDHMEGEWN